MDNSILKEVVQLAILSKKVNLEEKEKYLTQAQNILLEYLNAYPYCTDAWILLTRIECNSPFYDPERIIKYTNAVLSYDKGNIYALLFLSYADYYLMGSHDNTLVNKLSQAKSTDPHLLSLIEIAKARSWEFRNKEKYENSLLKSIVLCNDYATNYAMLGTFYIKKKKYDKGIPLIQKALFNQRKILSQEHKNAYIPIDISGFLKKFFIDAIGIDSDLEHFVNQYKT